MKRFLLALLMAGITLVVVDQASPASAADCWYLTYHYYDNPDRIGHPCGAFISFCDAPPYWEGCSTPYYELYYGGCQCSSTNAAGGGDIASLLSAGGDAAISTMAPAEDGHGSCAPGFSQGL